MRPHTLSLWTLLAGLASFALLPGCGGPPPDIQGGPAGSTGPNAALGGDEEPPSQPGKYGGKLVQAQVNDPKTLNYWLAAETTSSDILAPLYDSLIELNDYTLQFEPALAEALPEVSADGLTHTLRLREGLRWSDGQPITMEDVLFTLQVILDPSIQTNNRESLLIDIPQPDGSIQRKPLSYKALDERTIQFKLPAKYAPVNYALSFPIAPKHKLEAAYKAGRFNNTWGVNTPASELVTSGAWVMHEYQPRQRIIYRRNPHYWRKSDDGKQLPYLDEWIVLIVPDVNTATLKFRDKELDIVGVQPPEFARFKEEEGSGDYRVIERGPSWGLSFFFFNQNPAAKVDPAMINLFQQTKFRQAASHCLDRERICRDNYFTLAQPGWGPISPANKVFYDPTLPKYEFDLEKAKRLLDELGARDSNGNGFREWRGKEIRFNFLIYSGADIPKQVASIFTEDLQKAGINATYSQVEFNNLVMRLDQPPFEWDAAFIGFTANPEPHTSANLWRSSAPLHMWRPKQPKPATDWEREIDETILKGSQELDLEERKKHYSRFQHIVGEQQPLIYTVIPEQVTAIRNRFGNYKPCSSRISTWNMYEIFDTTATRDTP